MTAAAHVDESGFRSHLDDRIRRSLEAYGPAGMAALLGVHRSQPTRWRNGLQRPRGEIARRILELDYLTGRLAETFTATQARMWLQSPNPHLTGSPPAEVFARSGVSALDGALAAAEDGAPV